MSVRSPARPQRPASAELQRRRDLRRRKRVHFAAQLWSLLLLLSASAGLGWLLLRHGWLLRTPEQVQLTSRSPFNREQVISAAGLRFPIALLSLDGASLQQRLGAKLPVEDIRLQRQLWPPQLLIDLRLRQAVAQAQRHTLKAGKRAMSIAPGHGSAGRNSNKHGVKRCPPCVCWAGSQGMPAPSPCCWGSFRLLRPSARWNSGAMASSGCKAEL
ncbi:MAG: cell division protein FtsQ/DivIB [Prochlorococcaceae cyanobacterium]